MLKCSCDLLPFLQGAQWIDCPRCESDFSHFFLLYAHKLYVSQDLVVRLMSL